MSKFKTAVIFVLVVLLSVTLPPACSPGMGIDDLVQSFLPSEHRVFALGVSGSDMAALVNGNNVFALNLYKTLSKQDGNFFYSPYSISTAMAMTYAGARGETDKQMAQALSFSLPQDKLHQAFNNLDLDLNKRAETAKNGTGFQLVVANALWGQNKFPFLPEYIKTCSTYYDAKLTSLNFDDPKNSSTVINNWVSEKTNGKITNLVTPETIASTPTVLILTNAVYFNATWQIPFETKYTVPGTFYLLDGSLVVGNFMSKTDVYGYAEGKDYKLLELPYSDKNTAMDILLPGYGQLEELEQSLDYASLASILKTIKYEEIRVALPKFTFESQFSLKDALSKMGMPVAFGSADFSGIDGGNELWLDDVVHKSFINVDEKGTEAAAGTAAIVAGGMVDNWVKINRPFIFLIRDKTTDTILFVGRVLNPVTSELTTVTPASPNSRNLGYIINPSGMRYFHPFGDQIFYSNGIIEKTTIAQTELAEAGLESSTIQSALENSYIQTVEATSYTLKGYDFTTAEAAQAYFKSRQSALTNTQPTNPKIGDASFQCQVESGTVGKVIWFVKDDKVICVQEDVIGETGPRLSWENLKEIAFIVLEAM